MPARKTKDVILEKIQKILTEDYHRSDLVARILEFEYGK
jgi:hypothetical protein